MGAVIGLDIAEKTVFSFSNSYWWIPKPTSCFHYLPASKTGVNFNTVYVVGLTWCPEEATAMVTIETTDIETALRQSLLEVTVMGSGLA